MKRLKIALPVFLIAATSAQAAPHTYANPIDIDYRYNFESENSGISYRTGADPVIVRHKGAFYLFQTLADGYWRSTDLLNWSFITPNRWPAEGIVAPAAWSDGERLYLKPSATQPGPIYVTDAPETGRLEYLNRRTLPLPGAVMSGMEMNGLKEGQLPPGPWDPALFRDDDGRWYLYWNSSNTYPLYGMELDPKNRLAYKGMAMPLIALHPEKHGWERFGQDHSGTMPDGTPVKPFIEGAWMTKVRGRYYLQYGAPGTEYNAYANGTYVGDNPLGPFTYAPYNPVAYKPGGFVEGAGHGSTVEDLHGNWWNTGTPWIGDNWPFERRIGLFPARFYDDGQMAVSTRFGDFPHFMPQAKVSNPESLFTGWMLLSYRKAMSASSSKPGFEPARAADENPRTYWVAATTKPGEALTIDLGTVKAVRAVQVNFADYKSGRFGDAPDIYTAFTLQGSVDGRSWSTLADTGADHRDRTNAYFELSQAHSLRFVRYVHDHIGGANLAISDLRVFGNAAGQAPAVPRRVSAVRHPDRRDGRIAWDRQKDVVGYNVLWGLRPDRLTLCYQVFADEVGTDRQAALELRALNASERYFVAVEAFNETDVSKRSAAIAMP